MGYEPGGRADKKGNEYENLYVASLLLKLAQEEILSVKVEPISDVEMGVDVVVKYGKAFKRFMVFLANKYHLQKLANIAPKHIFAYLEYMQNKGWSESTIKTELAAIRFFHDSMLYTRYKLPTNNELELERRTFGGVNRTWTGKEFNLMFATAIETGHSDYTAILALARYASLRLEECFRIDTNDARKALETGKLFVKGKGGLTRYVPINASIRVSLENVYKATPTGQKLFVKPEDKIHLAMKRLQCFIAYHRKEFTDNRITFHGLRHSCATNLLKKGVDLKIIQEYLGHSTISTTANFYLHPDMEQKKDAIERLSQAFTI